MRVYLQPDSLGDVMVKVKDDGGGVMRAQVEVSNPSTKAVLDGNLAQLKDAMMSRGLDVRHIEVVANHQAAMNDTGTHQESKHQKSKQGLADDPELSAAEETGKNLGYNTMELVL
jgi:flagellar hook-length control protein FliK